MPASRKSFYRPRRADAGESENEWLVSFSDAMTLLVAFFVMMLTFSKVDMHAFEEVKAGIARDLAHRSVARPAAQLRAELDDQVDSLGVADAVRVNIFERGIVLELAVNAFFVPNTARLRPEARPLLERVAQTLTAPVYSKFRIAIEGHTDDRAPASARFATNWELSGAQATGIVRVFSDIGIPPGRLRAVAFADTQPKVANRDAAGSSIPENQAKNRRILIRIHR